MKVELRRAKVVDASAVARAHCASWRSTYAGIVPDPVIAYWADEAQRTEGWAAVIATAPGSVWLAEREGEPLGFANSGPCKHARPCAGGQLYAAYLVSHAQRQGIGHALLAAIFDDMLAAGYQNGCCEVIPGNAPAVRFYEKTGARFDREAPFEMNGYSMIEHVMVWDDLQQARQQLSTLMASR